MCTQLLSSGCAFQEGREVYLSHKNAVGAALAETARLQVTEDEADRYILLQQMPFSGSFVSHCLSEPVAEPLLTLIDVLFEVWGFIAEEERGSSQHQCHNQSGLHCLSADMQQRFKAVQQGAHSLSSKQKREYLLSLCGTESSCH